MQKGRSLSEPTAVKQAAETPREFGSSLKERTTRGFAWLTFQALASKAVGFVGMMVLTWLLSKADFALVGLCVSITTFGGLLRAPGLKEILIRRHAKFERWATSAFWLSLLLGLVTAALMMASGVVLVRLFPKLSAADQRQLYQLLVIAAAAIPFEALSVVPTAKLQSELRFREIAALGFGGNVASWALQVIFALLGWGPFAMVLPRPIIAAITGVLVMCIARVQLDWKPRVKRWRFMYRDSGLMTASTAMGMIVMQGDNFIVGYLYNKTIVGVYIWAYNMSLQTIVVFSSNLHGAVLPALAKMKNNRERQTGAYLRVTLLAGILGCFACLMQAGLARPVIHVLFHGKYDDAIPVFRLLSVNMAIALAGGPTGSLLQAQGRFGFQFLWGMVTAVIFLVAVWIGAVYGAAVGAAGGVLAQALLLVPIGCYMAIRPGGGRWLDVARVIGIPLGVSCLAVALPMALLKTGQWDRDNIISFVVMLLVPPMVYAAVIRVVFPAIWKESLGRLEAVVARLRGKGATA